MVAMHQSLEARASGPRVLEGGGEETWADMASEAAGLENHAVVQVAPVTEAPCALLPPAACCHSNSRSLSLSLLSLLFAVGGTCFGLLGWHGLGPWDPASR